MRKIQERAARGKRTILVVDDEAEVRQLLRRIFQADGFRVLCAADGQSALARLRRSAVDLVILDIRLPDLGGIEILAHIRRGREQLPVLMLTGHGHLDTARQAMQLGAYDYITKPFKLGLVKRLVHEALPEISSKFKVLRVSCRR